MEKYAITIRETISRTIIVEAEDLAEAVQRTEDWSYVKKKYKLNVTNFPFFCNC